MGVKNYPYNDHTQLSPHFNVQEFRCKCGKKHDILIDSTLIDKLERLYAVLDCSSIRVTSGHRCSEYDKAIGNSGTGQHILGKAADVCCYGQDKSPISSKLVCCKAQDLGFGGVANINVAYIYTHLDVRSGKVWYGDETVSNNTVTKDFYDYFKEAKTMIKGIDISEYQAKVDWSAVKASGIQFVILRAGIGQREDKCFQQHYVNAKTVGLPVGAYWYLKATTVAEALQEAEKFASVLDGKKFEYPIYLDLEYSSTMATGKSNCSAIIREFCNYLEAKGYWVGLYISRGHISTHLEQDITSRYVLWVADWTGSCKYKGTYGIWQSSETGKIPGINGNVDTDVSYVDYPEVIRAAGKNGYSIAAEAVEEELPPPPFPGDVTAPAEETVDTIEASVWHNGCRYTGTLYRDKE